MISMYEKYMCHVYANSDKVIFLLKQIVINFVSSMYMQKNTEFYVQENSVKCLVYVFL